ncbi:MAG: hypothetical protein IJ635_02130 [Bacteroidaceae bacterium]|nr:hypothetical protein [Bacteroidaceae bacterium]
MRRGMTLLFCLMAMVLTMNAQTVSQNFHNTPLAEVLERINNAQSDYRITFIHNELEHLQVNCNIKSMNTKEAVEKVCAGQPVKVKVKGKDIFVQYKPKSTAKTINLLGKVYDSRTHHELPGAMVYLLSKDSTVLDSCLAKSLWMDGYKSGYTADFHFTVPQTQETYLLSATYPNYEQGYMTYTISNLHRREFYRHLPPLYLIELGRMLKEVTVTASKVKFYHRGDTVVYDASAFQLAEGSMLDALVKQLPGVELKDDGRIYHDGKFVESLLLNGKEFFRGDNRVMLDNLPAYTVKDIKVYDKYGEKSEFLGRQLESDKQYVMDVVLKKEYSIGYLANLEAAGGTDDRYLARLFAMRFSDHSRLAVYANANNLNNGDNPSEQSVWQSGNAGTGMQKRQRAGIDYNVEDRDKRWKADGNVRFTHTDNNQQTTTHRVNYLSTGNTYERSRNQAKDHSLFLSTDHILEWQHKQMRWVLNPKANYLKMDNKSGFTSTALTAADSLINHNTQQGILRGYDLFAGLSLQSTLKFKNSSDHMDFGASANFTKSDNDRFNRQDIQSSSPVFTDQYFKGHPDWKHEYKGHINYTYYIMKGMSLEMNYDYSRKDEHRQQTLYLLDRLDHRDSIGVLPSLADYERTMDLANSYDSHLTEDSHTLHPFLWWFPKTKGGKWSISLRLPMQVLHQRLHYQRGTVDTTIVRNPFLIASEWNYAQWNSKDGKYTVFIQPQVAASAPALQHFVDIRDATDPLNIHLGNNGLRNTYRYSLRVNTRKRLPEKQIMEAIGAEYRYVQNELAMSHLFDPTTGVHTYQPFSVNGNWRFRTDGSIHAPLDKPKRLFITAGSALILTHSVDLTGTTTLERSTVNTTSWTPAMELSYKFNEQNHVKLVVEPTWQWFHSRREDFQNFHTADCKTTLTALAALPWKVQLSTDLTLYSRRGYNDPSMNDTEWCWNARLSRSFLHGNFILMLDGFDLLNQLSNITQTMNAQGRTETWTNTLHRYVLLHAVYRLNKQPKKKK